MKGLRFQKRIKILPGVRLNFSKSGVTTTVGQPGASVNLNGRKRRTTVGLPGTGLSYSETHTTPDAPRHYSIWWLVGFVVLIVWLLAGCSTIDRPAQSRFEPLPIKDGVRQFKFTAIDSIPWPHDTPEGEAERMRWLTAYLQENAMCPAGHEVTSRETSLTKFAIGQQVTIYYQGRCKS